MRPANKAAPAAGTIPIAVRTAGTLRLRPAASICVFLKQRRLASSTLERERWEHAVVGQFEILGAVPASGGTSAGNGQIRRLSLLCRFKLCRLGCSCSNLRAAFGAQALCPCLAALEAAAAPEAHGGGILTGPFLWGLLITVAQAYQDQVRGPSLARIPHRGLQQPQCLHQARDTHP